MRKYGKMAVLFNPLNSNIQPCLSRGVAFDKLLSAIFFLGLRQVARVDRPLSVLCLMLHLPATQEKHWTSGKEPIR